MVHRHTQANFHTHKKKKVSNPKSKTKQKKPKTPTKICNRQCEGCFLTLKQSHISNFCSHLELLPLYRVIKGSEDLQEKQVLRETEWVQNQSAALQSILPSRITYWLFPIWRGPVPCNHWRCLISPISSALQGIQGSRGIPGSPGPKGDTVCPEQ